MKSFVFLLAMDYEIDNIFKKSEWSLELRKPFKVLKHRKNSKIKIVKMGLGKVNAAAAAQFTLDKFDPAKIINLGAVGCVNKKLSIGEVRRISECRFFDVDITALGCKLGQIYGCNLVSYKLLKKNKMPSAKVVSGDSFVSDKNKLSKIIKEFSPDFIDMEIGAVAHTLYLNGKLKRLESYKAPSDYSDSSAAKDFKENEKKAFINLSIFASNLLKKISE